MPVVAGGLAAQPVDGLVAGGGDDHPAGLGGGPVDGQQATAAANASWTASSARSMSPKSPTRTATARPYCSRKTPSTSEAGAWPARQAQSPASPWNGRTSTGGVVAEASLPPQRGVQVGGLDDGEPTDVLLAFGEGPVGDEHLSAGGPPWPCLAGAAPGEHPPRPPHLLVQGVEVTVDPLQLLSWRRRPVGLDHAQQVLLHRDAPSLAVTGR